MASSNFDDRILTVAISSRALFDLEDSNRVYEEEGLEAYRKYQIAHEDEPLEPGEAYPFVKKLLNINVLLDRARVEVILLSRNSADTGLRVFNSIQSHGLNISRAAFCGGERPYRYVQAFKCDLFLSTDSDDVVHALDHGVAAATLLVFALARQSVGRTSNRVRRRFGVVFRRSRPGISARRSRCVCRDGTCRSGSTAWRGVRSRTSSVDCIVCRRSSKGVLARFARRWSPRAPRLRTSESSARCGRGTSGWTNVCSWAVPTRRSFCGRSAQMSSSMTRRRTASGRWGTWRRVMSRGRAPDGRWRDACYLGPK